MKLVECVHTNKFEAKYKIFLPKRFFITKPKKLGKVTKSQHSITCLTKLMLSQRSHRQFNPLLVLIGL